MAKRVVPVNEPDESKQIDWRCQAGADNHNEVSCNAEQLAGVILNREGEWHPEFGKNKCHSKARFVTNI